VKPDSVLDNLNEAQREAVAWGHAPLLIIAGAGSGKTRILTHRIAHLISQGIPSFNILGVTFTNKAAQEMKARVQKLVSHDVWVSTFHSTCLRILRMDGAAIGLDPRFSIYDEHDQLTLVKECIKELNLNEKQAHPKGVREQIQRAKDFLMTPFQYLEKSQDMFEGNVGKVYQLYEEKMAKLKACDFGDLIMKTVFLFDRKPAILEGWQDRFQHILIDEYQDTNHAQYRLVKLLASKRRQITVVGDPDQSIYAWRGADINNILNFEVDYPECGMIKMERNYRSTSVILDAANALIRRNQLRKAKDLWTEKKGGDPIRIFEACDEKEEARYVVDQIQRHVQNGRTLADQVIFYRIHAQSRIYEDVLRRFNIPYKIVGGIRFYDRREIKDLIAYLKIIQNPHDDVSLKRILNVPTRGIGKKAYEILASYGQSKKCSFDEVLRDSKEIQELTPKIKNSIAGFYQFIETLRGKQNELAVSEILTKILEFTGYVEELEAERTIEAKSRIENIEEFFSVINDFEEEQAGEGKSGLLEKFLESISLMTDLDAWDNGTNVLTLMTFHTAKGLEFPIVYMVGLEEGIFPNVKSYSDDPHDLEEERRLCYVGITRCKELLYFMYARERRLHGAKQYNLPSRFLNEVPRETINFDARQMYENLGVEKSDMIEDFDDVIDYESGFNFRRSRHIPFK